MTVASPLPEEESYERPVDIAHWKRLFRYALSYRRDLAFLALGGMVTAGADAAFPLVTKEIIEDVAAHGLDVNFTGYAVAYGILTLLISAGVFTFIWFGGKVRTFVSHDIRRDAFANLQRLSFSYFDHRPVGWLMARMTSDCERLSNIFAWGVLDIFWGFTLMGAVTGAMLFLNVKLALVVLSVVPVLMVASVFFQRRILRTARIVRKTNSRITAFYNEAIMGVRTSKVFGREAENLEEFQDLTLEMEGASVRNAVLSAIYLPLVMTLGSLGTGLVLALGGYDVLGGVVSVATLVTFVYYTRLFFEPVQELSHWVAELQMAQASAERILSVIETEPEIRDSEEVSEAIEKHRRETVEGLADDGARAHIGKIELREVCFSYEDDQPVVQSFDLEVEAGETIALVGSTGGGKTTLLNLLCRFYEPTSGAILFDGVDYRQRSLRWLQSNLGIVLQEPHLFSGSVADNIRYGNLDATEAEIFDAARLAGAHDFVEELPAGYETDVGEGGNRLSTGQKQLISFARAIVARPQILVMDEATSSVDTETELRIQEGLTHVLEGRTSFVIAHRLSTIRAADRILVIEEGRIRESGSHDELMSHRGRYYELYTEQRVREAEGGVLDAR